MTTVKELKKLKALIPEVQQNDGSPSQVAYSQARAMSPPRVGTLKRSPKSQSKIEDVPLGFRAIDATQNEASYAEAILELLSRAKLVRGVDQTSNVYISLQHDESLNHEALQKDDLIKSLVEYTDDPITSKLISAVFNENKCLKDEVVVFTRKLTDYFEFVDKVVFENESEVGLHCAIAQGEFTVILQKFISKKLFNQAFFNYQVVLIKDKILFPAEYIFASLLCVLVPDPSIGYEVHPGVVASAMQDVCQNVKGFDFGFATIKQLFGKKQFTGVLSKEMQVLLTEAWKPLKKKVKTMPKHSYVL